MKLLMVLQTKQDDMKDVTLNNSNTKAETKPKVNNKKGEKKVKESPVLLNKTTVSIEAEKEIVVVEEEKKESEYFEIDYSPIRPSVKRKPNNNRGRKAKLTKTISLESNESIENSESLEPIAHVERTLEIPEDNTQENVADVPIESPISLDITDFVADETQEFSTLQELQEPTSPTQKSDTESKELESQPSSYLSAESKSFVPSGLVPLKVKRKKLFDSIDCGYREDDLPFEMFHHVPNTSYGSDKTRIIDRNSTSDWYVLMWDLEHAAYIALDFEFTGASLMGVDTDCLAELQMMVANKCSILQTGIVLVNAKGDRSVWRIDASPPTNLFFTSLDFLKACGFSYPDYINRRLNLNDFVAPFLAKAIGIRKPFVFHNAIYDILHILKMMRPNAFAELVHSKVKGIEDIEMALKNHLPYLCFLDTRSVYTQNPKLWLAAAQREQGYDEIEEPYSERLEELAYTLLSEKETTGIEFHDAAGDALVTAKLFSFFRRNDRPSESILALVLNRIFSKKRSVQE